MNAIDLCFWLLDTRLLSIQSLAIADSKVCLAVESRREQTLCPACMLPSARLHSYYPRDLPWAYWPVVLQLRVKRFFCENPTCPKRTFAERFPGLVEPYASKTQRVAERQHWISVNLWTRTAELVPIHI